MKIAKKIKGFNVYSIPPTSRVPKKYLVDFGRGNGGKKYFTSLITARKAIDAWEKRQYKKDKVKF